MKKIEEAFQALADNNKDKDWNNPVFRNTMKNAFLYCANQHLEEQKKNYDTKLLYMKTLINSNY